MLCFSRPFLIPIRINERVYSDKILRDFIFKVLVRESIKEEIRFLKSLEIIYNFAFH